MSVEGEQSFDKDDMEKWLRNYFLDPLTSYYDQAQFHIDLFETENEWIIEALLDEFESSKIIVHVEHNKLVITGKRNFFSPKINNKSRFRTIEFPFPINQKKITASFQNGILEVFISKEEKDLRKNRYISLP